MFKLLLFLIGAAGGAAGAVSWMLGEPHPELPPSAPYATDSLRARVEALKVQFQQALTEGKQSGRITEERMRADLDVYRKGSTPPVRT